MKNIFIDLDGTAAKWNTWATIEDIRKKGYWAGLEPTEIAGFANRLSRGAFSPQSAGKAYRVYILSAYMPDTDAFWEKRDWTARHIPDVPRHAQIFMPCGTSKAKAVSEIMHRKLTKEDVLVDDHTPNLIDWEEAGGMGIKWLNGINGKGGVFRGNRTNSTEELRKLLGI